MNKEELEFKSNVDNWSKVRGIHDWSSEAHQQAKALEEIGELIASENDDERIDAIGDIAVCIVNASYFGRDMDLPEQKNLLPKESWLAKDVLEGSYGFAFERLRLIANKHGFYLKECLDKAWNEIKDRKGMMVNGKYVKWDNLNGAQRAELNNRLRNN